MQVIAPPPCKGLSGLPATLHAERRNYIYLFIYLQVIAPLAGIVVIDVVEGSALAALPFMIGVLNSRPTSFASLQEAIHWATSSGTPPPAREPMRACMAASALGRHRRVIRPPEPVSACLCAASRVLWTSPAHSYISNAMHVCSLPSSALPW